MDALKYRPVPSNSDGAGWFSFQLTAPSLVENHVQSGSLTATSPIGSGA